MGYNTTIVVLNDRLGDIERDPEFGKKLVAAIRAYKPGRQPYVTGQTQIIGQHHADGLIAYVIGGNTGTMLGYCGHYTDFDDPDKMIKELAASRKREKARGEI